MPFAKTKDQVKAVRLQGTPAKHILLFGGSRSGKSAISLRSMGIRACKAEKTRHLILRRHFNAVKRSIWNDTLPFVMAEAFPNVPIKWNHSEHYLQFPNESQIWIGGLDDKDRAERILGTEYSTIQFEEAPEFAYNSVTTALTRLSQKSILDTKAYYTANPPTKRHWLHKLFIQGVNPETNAKIVRRKLYANMLMNPDGNRANLAPGYIEEILGELPERQRRRFKDGEWLDDLEGALWNRSTMIDEYRVVRAPEMRRIVIGVDPAVSNTAQSAEHGIISVGEGIDGDYYVMNDDTLHGTPNQWGTVVVNRYRKLRADCVVPEVNNGGDLVVSNIHNIDPSVRVKAVRATRGKIIRAEPIAGLYEQGRVHHVGEFPELEDQMCSYDPSLGMKSPDRMDGLVWAVTELTEKPKKLVRAIG